MDGSAAKTTNQRFEILRWLFWDNHKLTGYMATYRFLRAFTPPPDPKILTFLRKRLDDYPQIGWPGAAYLSIQTTERSWFR
jgi:hypothetical protein